MTLTLPLPLLDKICKRYERRGILSGTMKLGRDLDNKERAMLENFFGLAPLTHTLHGELKLSFDRLLAGKSEEDKKAWIDQIYHLAQRPKPEPEQQEDSLSILLDQLRLSFPDLAQVHELLRSEETALRRRWQRDMQAAKEHLFTVAGIVEFLRTNQSPITLSELGARFCANSKSLRQGELHQAVARWLRALRPDLPEQEDVFTEFLVVRDRLTISALVFGPLVYEKNGRRHDWIDQLYRAGEPAMLNWLHLEDVSDLCPAPGCNGDFELITCENESPFSRLLREREKKATNRIVLFTSGFPNRAVRRLYQLLAPHVLRCRHWGDSDPAGLRIAAILHEIHPLTLWRCDLETLRSHRQSLLPLTMEQQKAASTLGGDPAFPFHGELQFSRRHGWLEQESWSFDQGYNSPDTMV